jgi:TPR repeat protein
MNSLKYHHTQHVSLPGAKVDRDAKYNLGWMFQNGKGVEANAVKAFEWYKKGILF